ncbi:hypothetical protein HY493_03065 [Candidatus Woesearchaeota archaeon]|nr:hypothetical protein [Candidatus Woesearchaeota archaeon]
MSNITLIVIKGRRIHVLQTHWRTVKALLEHGFDGVLWQKHENRTEDLDAGYILVDLNTGTVVNEQNAFAAECF